MTGGRESRPEACGFRFRPRSGVWDRVVLTPEAASIEESARGDVALLLADLACREHRHPEMRPQTSPRKDKSTAHRATHSPTTARKGAPMGKFTGGPVKCLNRPQEGPANRPYFAYKIFGLGSIRGVSPLNPPYLTGRSVNTPQKACDAFGGVFKR